MIDYEVLRFIWWLLIGVLLIGFAVTDGFDMGVGMLTRFLGRNDTERRIMINSIAPHWDGNQVWLITAGGALFAAWPMVYAAAFSGFYVAMILVLASLFFRPVGFDYRSKIEDTRWRNMWDWGIFIGSFVPPLVIGVAFGNLLQGVPFHLDEYMRLYYTGNFFQLLNPFGLLAGIVSVAMIITQGATYLQMRTVGELHLRSRATAQVAALVTLVCFALAGVWVVYGIDGYVVTSAINHTAPSNPLTKEVARQAGAWLVNFNTTPVLWTIPALGVLLPLLSADLTRGTNRFNLCMGIFGLAVGIGGTLSTTVAGATATWFGSGAAFGLLAVVGLLSFLLVLFVMPETGTADPDGVIRKPASPATTSSGLRESMRTGPKLVENDPEGVGQPWSG